MSGSRDIPPGRNLTGIRWTIDVHVIDNSEATDLIQMYRLGWIDLQTTDTLLTELSERKDDAHREELMEAAEPFPVAMGPMILDHSLLGLGVLGSEQDEERLRLVYSVLWPGNSYEADGAMASAKGRTRYRDAMHVATSIRYRFQGFVTNDQGILARATELAERFDGFQVLSVSDATDLAKSSTNTVRTRAALPLHSQDPNGLPDWP